MDRRDLVRGLVGIGFNQLVKSRVGLGTAVHGRIDDRQALQTPALVRLLAHFLQRGVKASLRDQHQREAVVRIARARLDLQ